MKPPFLLAALLLCLVSCDKKQDVEQKKKLIENGSLTSSLVYTAEQVGWQTTVPADWKVMTPEQKAKATETGKKALEKTAGSTVDTAQLKELLNLSKDKANSFLSTIEPYSEATDGSYSAHSKEVLEVLVQTYKNAGVKLGKVATGKDTVDGLEFETVEIEILHPTSGAVVLSQKYYWRLINGYDFGITISTNNDKDRQALLSVVTSSKFSKRD